MVYMKKKRQPEITAYAVEGIQYKIESELIRGGWHSTAYCPECGNVEAGQILPTIEESVAFAKIDISRHHAARHNRGASRPPPSSN